MSEAIWRASQKELLEMANTAEETPSRYIHLITQRGGLVCRGEVIVSTAPSNLAHNIQLGTLSLGEDPEMLLITKRAKRASCARCVYIFNEDMKQARADVATLCKTLGTLAGLGGVVAMVVIGIMWLT